MIRFVVYRLLAKLKQEYIIVMYILLIAKVSRHYRKCVCGMHVVYCEKLGVYLMQIMQELLKKLL